MTEGRCGNPRYLAEVRNCIHEGGKLLGVFKRNINMTQQAGVSIQNEAETKLRQQLATMIAATFPPRLRQRIATKARDSPSPPTNRHARRAGNWLAESVAARRGRPIPDRYDGIFTWAEQLMNFVRSSKLRLDAVVFDKGTNAPEATYERSRGAYGPGIGGYGTGPLAPPGPFCG